MKMNDSRILSYLQKLGYSFDGAKAVINSPNRKYVEKQLIDMESFIKIIRKDEGIDPMDVLFASSDDQSIEVEVVSKKSR